jgi:hypothetical protein
LLEKGWPAFGGTCVAHDPLAAQGRALGFWDGGAHIGVQFRLGEEVRVLEVGVERQEEGRALMDEAHARMAVPMDAPLMALGRAEESFEVQIIPREVGVVAADKEAGSEGRHGLRQRAVRGFRASLPAAPEGLE